MARQKAGRKAYAALDLLTALYEPRVRAALDPYGFTDADVERGWALLRAFAQVRRAATPTRDVSHLVKQLDDWENHWFVVCNAATARAFPEVNRWLFHDLSRTSGFGVMFTTVRLVQRIRNLGAARAPVKGAKAARARLLERGVTDEVLAQVDALGEQLRFPEEEQAEPPSPEPENAAEDELWGWYLEWSGIARTAVRDDKTLLNHLGFGKVGRPRGSKKKPAGNE